MSDFIRENRANIEINDGQSYVIELVDICQNWQEESTTHWFRVDDESYGICHSESDHSMLDRDGAPIYVDGLSPGREEVSIYKSIIKLSEDILAE